MDIPMTNLFLKSKNLIDLYRDIICVKLTLSSSCLNSYKIYLYYNFESATDGPFKIRKEFIF